MERIGMFAGVSRKKRPYFCGRTLLGCIRQRPPLRQVERQPDIMAPSIGLINPNTIN